MRHISTQADQQGPEKRAHWQMGHCNLSACACSLLARPEAPPHRHSFGGESLVTSSNLLTEGPLRGGCSEVGPSDAENAKFAWTLSRGSETRSVWQMWPPSCPAQARHRRRSGNAKRRRSTRLLRKSAAHVKVTDDTGKSSGIAPSPSPPQPPRPTTLQLWLHKPKIDQSVKELERQIGQIIALGEAGQVNRQLHDF